MIPGLAIDQCGGGWIVFLHNGELWAIGKRDDDDTPMIKFVVRDTVETYQENPNMFRKLTQVYP